MSINNLIINALQPLNVPVAFLVYSGTTTPYITFSVIDERTAFVSDDLEKATIYTVQVDVFHTGNYNSLVDSVKQKLSEIGFRRQNQYDFYEIETKLYHKILRFYYSKEV